MADYIYPDIGRPGLANSLLPLGRAVVLSHRTGVPLLAPQWARFRIGPYLRGERDKRDYWRFMRADPSDVRGLLRLAVLAASKRTPETNALDELARTGGLTSGGTVVVSGLGEYFIPLRGHGALLRASFTRRVTDDALTAAKPGQGTFIAAHVRRGDFTLNPSHVTPLEWFVDRIQAMRSVVGANTPVYVVSDGDRDDLALLLALPGVERWTGRSAPDEMLLLSDARVVIGSGSSTFSMLGAFLGDVPLIMPPRGNLQAGVYGDASMEAESALGSALPESIVKTLGMKC